MNSRHTRAAIVGGGIGGLVMALQCHQRGIDCMVFEVGAAARREAIAARYKQTTGFARAQVNQRPWHPLPRNNSKRPRIPV